MPLDPQALTGAKLSTYEEIREAALLRIPRYTPEWTDYNESDPGVTLVELFAWLTEMLMYEMRQVPARNYMTFLRNLGQELGPPEPAVALLALTAQPGAATQSVSAGSQFRAQPADGGEPLAFETAEGVSLIRPPLDAVQVFDGVGFSRVNLPAAGESSEFRPFGWTAQPGSALYLGFNNAEGKFLPPLFPADMRFYVFLPPARQAGRGVDCRVVGADAPPPAPVVLSWEHRINTPGGLRWRPLAVFRDDSVAFTREGAIHVAGPPSAIVATKEGSFLDVERFWLRVRIVSGSYPAASIPQIAALTPNVARARNLATVRNEVLGASRGTPGQRFPFARRPVYAPTGPGSRPADRPTIRINETGGDAAGGAADGELWERRDTLFESGPDDPHYTLAPAAGEIQFGDGRNGRIPAAGALIVAEQYIYGGGSRGNVGEGTIVAPITQLTGVAAVTNPQAAAGGAEEQSVDDFFACAPANLRHLNRAVASEDFEALALQVGGIARARALPLYHPDHPDVEVPGCVTVLIVPDSPAMPPQPTQAQLEAVCRYLEAKRLLTTELKVSPPRFRRVRVEAIVDVAPYAAFDEVTRQVGRAIDDFLAPLPPKGGASGGPMLGEVRGSDFGLDLHPSRLLETILRVPDVRAAHHVRLYVEDQPHADLSEPITARADTLLYSAGGHDITAQPYQDR